MADKKDKPPDKTTIDGLAAEVRRLGEKVERHSINWRKFFNKFVKKGGDGKVGSVRVAVIGLLTIGILVGVAYGRNMGGWNSSQFGTFRPTTDDAGTGTLYVDALVANTGTITNMALTTIAFPNGEGINNTADTNVTVTYDTVLTTGIVAEFWMYTSVTNADTDTHQFGSKFVNTTNEATKAYQLTTIIQDVTDETEDAYITVGIMEGGTLTTEMTVTNGQVKTSGGLHVGAAATIMNGLTLNGDLTGTNGATVSNNDGDMLELTETAIRLIGTVTNTGATTLESTLNVAAAVNLAGNTTNEGSLLVNLGTTFNGDLTGTNGATISNNDGDMLELTETAIRLIGTVTNTGATTLESTLNVGAAVNLAGNTTNEGSLLVNLGITFNGDLTGTNGATISNDDGDMLELTETAIRLIGTVTNTGATTLEGTLNVVAAVNLAGNATNEGSFLVNLGTTLNGDVTMTNGATISNNDGDMLELTETAIRLIGTVTNTGATTLESTLTVTDAITGENGGTIANTNGNILAFTETAIRLVGSVTNTGATTFETNVIVDAASTFAFQGRWPLAGPNASTQFTFETFSGTLLADGKQTNSYATAFASAPIVIVNYDTAHPASDGLAFTNIYTSTKAVASNILTGLAGESYEGVAIGAK